MALLRSESREVGETVCRSTEPLADRIVRYLVNAVVLIGTLVLVGWFSGLLFFTSFSPNLVSMKANSAVCLILCAVALRARRFWLPCVLLVFGVGFATIGEYLFGWSLGIDQLLVRDPVTLPSDIPGRMGLHTAVTFILMGTAVVLLRSNSKRGILFGQFFSLLGSLLPFMALVGYFYGIESLYHPASTNAMAVHTTVSLLCLSGALLLSQHQSGFMAMFVSLGAGGTFLRRLTPLVVLVPIVFGKLILLATHARWMGGKAAIGVLVICCVAVLFVALWVAASHLEEQLRKSYETLEHLVQERTTEIENAKIFLESVLENIPNMVFVKDAKDLRFVRFNRAGEELIGYSRRDLIGKNDYDFFPKEQADFFTLKDRAVLESRALEHIQEEPIQTRHKGVRILSTKKVPIFDVTGNPLYLLGISEDITEQKESARLLAEQRAKMVASSSLAELGKMAGGIGHELNTPLGMITMSAEKISLLCEERPINLKKMREYASIIENTGFRIAKIVKSLRAIGRECDGEPMGTHRVLDLVEGTLAFCRERFHSHGISISVNIHQDLTVDCREVQISQLLLNLLNNAYDALEAAPTKLISIDSVERDSWVELAVSDSGSGVSAEIQDAIFRPFFTTKEFGKGTGLGLSISEGIARAHGGSLSLDVKSARTRFVLKLPKQQRGELEKKLSYERKAA